MAVYLACAFQDAAGVLLERLARRCTLVFAGAPVVEGHEGRSLYFLDFGEELRRVFVGVGEVEQCRTFLIPEGPAFENGAVFYGARYGLGLACDSFARFLMRNGPRERIPAFGEREVEYHAYVDEKEGACDTEEA